VTKYVIRIGLRCHIDVDQDEPRDTHSHRADQLLIAQPGPLKFRLKSWSGLWEWVSVGLSWSRGQVRSSKANVTG